MIYDGHAYCFPDLRGNGGFSSREQFRKHLQMGAGSHSVNWNADTFSSGLYFVKMIAGEYMDTQKLMLVK